MLKCASKFSSQSVWCSIYCHFPETESEPKSRLQLPREKEAVQNACTPRPSKQSDISKRERYTYIQKCNKHFIFYCKHESRKMHSVSLTVSNLCTQQNKINKKSTEVQKAERETRLLQRADNNSNASIFSAPGSWELNCVHKKYG